MSRVSDAMRRAGHEDDEPKDARSEESAFEQGEEGVEGVEEPIEYEAPPPGTAPRPVPMELVHQPPAAIPIEVTRSEPVEDVRLSEIFRILNRRRWLIVGVIALAVGGAAAYNRMATPIYEARAQVVVQPSVPQVGPFRAASEDVSRQDYFVTQLEVMRSRAMARKTLEQLNVLSSDPARQSGQIGQFLGSLRVSHTTSDLGESRVVNVSYQSEDPRLAARMANGLAQAYVNENLETLRKGSRDAAGLLNERLDDLRRAVSASEGTRQQYLERQDASSLQEGQNVVLQKYMELTTAVTAARSERLAKETTYEQLRELESKKAPLDTFPPIQADPTTQRLKAELAVLEGNRAKLSEKFLPDWPELKEVENEIRITEARLNAEMGKVVQTIRNTYEIARANERELSKELDSQKREVLDLSKKSIGYDAIQRETSSAQQIFESVLQQVKQTDLSGDLQSNNIRILDNAEVPNRAIWPRKPLNLALGFLGGAFLAVGLVFVLEFVNPRLAEPKDIAGALGLPLLGIAPEVSELSDRSAALSALPVQFQEAIRGIRTQIFLSAASSGARTLAITSARPGEGKTVVSSSLAVSMAMAGRRVLLIDGDLRRAQLRHVFNIPRSPGLSNVIAGEMKPSQALVESSVKGLYVLPAGDEMANPGDLLDSERLNQLIQGLKQVFDLVIIDCPPVMAVADASIVANAANSVVFVVGSGTTSPEVAQLAVDRLNSVQARVVGVVLNKAKVDGHSEYYYPYHSTEDPA